MTSPQADIHIRPAGEADHPAICALIPSPEELFLVYPRGRHPLTVEQLASLAAERHALTVMTDGEQVIGFANLYGLEAGSHAFIGNVIVARTHRGQGLGRRLVRYMLDVAFGRHELREVCISVFNDNTAALLLYAGLGFVPYAIEERRHPQGRRTALLHLRLAAADRASEP
ncbi:MAG: GNAT family N-acetyltransferase [Ectothiorhodospiraceae bacterium]|nr:GNAT family N-acetyltransferase [Ectothiorhodospiraceae bacterium]